MLNVLKSLLDTYGAVANKIQAGQLFDEAKALFDAKEYKAALSMMKEASDMGSPYAACYVGIMHMKGLGVAQDWKVAAAYLELGIEGDVPLAKSNLGLIYGIGGYGLRRDIKQATLLLEQSVSETGDAQDAQALEMIKKKQGPFGVKEQARPKIQW